MGDMWHKAEHGGHGDMGGPGGAGGRSASPAAVLTSEGRAVTSRPRDESRCRDAAPGHAGPPPRPSRGQRRQRQQRQRRAVSGSGPREHTEPGTLHRAPQRPPKNHRGPRRVPPAFLTLPTHLRGTPVLPPRHPKYPLPSPSRLPEIPVISSRDPQSTPWDSHHPSSGPPISPPRDLDHSSSGPQFTSSRCPQFSCSGPSSALEIPVSPPRDPRSSRPPPPRDSHPPGFPGVSKRDPRPRSGRPFPILPLRPPFLGAPQVLSLTPARCQCGGSGRGVQQRPSPLPPPSAPPQSAPLSRLLLPGGPGGAPRARPGGTAALGALLRCFPCERLCGGCAVPPGALPPAMPPPPRRHLPPAARLPPRTFRSYLPRSHRTYSCVHCRAHLARHEELISKSFQGSHGRAYLFNSVVNVGCGPAEQRLLLTGLHSVADIFCQSCKTTLGWKYEQAFESSQKYKEGKFIIEMSHMVKENGWD
ncbi:protein yippee-like 4 isoform X1 [Pithys albifrons albifrons]